MKPPLPHPPLTRFEVLRRGATGHCPRCAGDHLFVSWYRLAEACPDCGLPLDREDGFSYGAVPLNYSLTCTAWVLPMAIAALTGLLPVRTALILAGVGVLVFPWLTYRYSKCVWVGVYYAILIEELSQTAPPTDKAS